MRLLGPAHVRSGLAAVALLFVLPAQAVAQVPPDERYLTFDTDHFRVVYPERMEAFARRAASSAEWAYDALSRQFMQPPSGRIALVIADHTDRPNASATPIPTNRVVLIATPDIASRTLNYYTDWVASSLVHELTHIFHLDRADGVWGLAQTLFGRVPAFFPAFYQPRWVIEGLPTYYESRLTGAGRAYGSSIAMMLDADASGGDFRTIDAADGLSPLWPSGHTPYAYGGLYFRSMAEQYGDSAVARFTRRGAARLPYTLNWASSPYFGRTLSGSWKDWSHEYKREARARIESLAALGLTQGKPLSGHAWVAPSPRFSPDGRYVAFEYITPHDDPATMIVDVGTGEVVLRKRRNSSGGSTWGPDGDRLYFVQVDYTGRYTIHGDLYELDVAAGKERRLTRGRRIASPDLAPDGRTLVAVETGDGSNRLVSIDLRSLEFRPLTEFDEGVNWERPRWSPAGNMIAAERTERGRVLDLVVVDTAGEVIWQVTHDDAADVSPAWSPDGRYLLWASDRDGASDIYAAEVPEKLPVDRPRRGVDRASVAGGRVWRVTRTANGASDPDVSPDGRWLALAAVYSDGVRVEMLPLDTAMWRPAGPGRRFLRQPSTPAMRASVEPAIDQAPARAYSPFPSLWPRSWLPIVYTGSSAVGTFVGATTFGADDVRRHSYAILAGWRTEVSAVEAGAVYRYAGLGDPVLELGLWQDWSSGRLATTDGGSVDVVEREREARISARFFRPRMRTALSIIPALGIEERRFTPADTAFSELTVTDAIAGLVLGYSRARGYPRSVSAEKGFVAVLDLGHRRRTDDFDRWRVSAEAELRGYLSFPVFGYANHVVAARLAFGASDGRDRSPELFELGGVPGRAIDVIAGVAIGGGSQYPVRGFSEGVKFGDRIASASLEYRLPLALVGRGYGLWPVMLDRLSLSLFADAGSAWRESDDIDVLASLGSELSVDLGLGYQFVYRFRVGVAQPIVDSGDDLSLYFTTGIAF